MYIKNICAFLCTIPLSINLIAQENKQAINAEKDSIYISETEDFKGKDKVLHAEPLFIDLIRDLGARKGEKEWNVGMGMADNLRFDSYDALVEYEWAPMDRLGLEIELPFTFFSPQKGTPKDSVPSSKLNGIKTAIQWSFFVNEKYATSMALGYINEIHLSDFRNFGNPFVTGNGFNPFLVIAKRWKSNFHSLIYTGPAINYHYKTRDLHFRYDINTSFHYMIPGTRNFVGLEFNKQFHEGDFDMTIRPQMRLAISHNLMLGIVVGVPINRENQRFSTFLRVIYEPEGKKKKGHS